MTNHDKKRLQIARDADVNDLESVMEAILALQSTDDPDPEFARKHEELQARRQELVAARDGKR